MITVNMHEAKTRLSELVKAVEEKRETILLCRGGNPVAQISALKKPTQRRDQLKPDPRLKVRLAPGYHPAEPLSDDEWPRESQ